MATSDFDDKAKEWDSPEKQERAEKIADSIRSHVPLSTDMSAFEYGCGTGLLSFELRDDLGPITLADNSEGMLDVLRDKIETHSADDMTPVELDLSEDPLPEERFDLVYTMMTLHHISDTEQILSQFYDLLHFGGCLCIADLDKEDGSFHGPDADVHQGFDRSELTDLVKDIGFINIRFATAYNMEHEINDDGDTKMFPVFLMVAVKKEI
jgi:ubiquinone/menaquinone biosynthesis C-methylase UbiE